MYLTSCQKERSFDLTHHRSRACKDVSYVRMRFQYCSICHVLILALCS